MKVLGLFITALALLAAPAAAAQEDRDVQARDLFVAGKYDQALVAYRALHQSTGHPTYLRNIGRCHQMLRQPAPAIASFRAYLREARQLEAAERREIEGYIAEMEALPAPPPSLAVPPEQAPPGAPPVELVERRSAAAEPVTRKWWFWTGVGALVAGAVVTALVIGGGQGNHRPPCPAGVICPP
jgi:hypothetical protein